MTVLRALFYIAAVLAAVLVIVIAEPILFWFAKKDLDQRADPPAPEPDPIGYDDNDPGTDVDSVETDPREWLQDGYE